MNSRIKIDQLFDGKAFERPLFHSYPGGIRFELSEGGTAIEQFLTALGKANEICLSIFSAAAQVTVGLRVWCGEGRFSCRAVLQELLDAGIKIPKDRSTWLEPTGNEGSWITVVFPQPIVMLKNLLWCALAADAGSIRPRPLCLVYLFNLDKGIMAFPYDDRGMDVVGPNHDFLSSLYREHHKYLLAHDLESMRSSFEPLPDKSSQPTPRRGG